MLCPKCGKELILGKLYTLNSLYYRNGPFWAEKSYFIKETFPNAKDAEKKGVGFAILPAIEKIDVAFSNLPEAYACKDCKLFVMDCNVK